MCIMNINLKWSNNVMIIQIDFLKNDVSEYHQLWTYRGYRKRCLHLDLHVIYIFAVSKMRFSSFTYNVSHLSQANAFVAIIVQFRICIFSAPSLGSFRSRSTSSFNLPTRVYNMLGGQTTYTLSGALKKFV